MVNRTLHPRTCEWCSGTYWTWKHHQRFCSRSCRTKHTWRPANYDAMHAAVAAANAETHTGRPAWNKGRPWSEQTIEKIRRKARPDFLRSVRGGNGKGMSKHEHLLSLVLGPEWRFSFAVSLGGREPGYPTNYKVDFGHPGRKMAIEVDGAAHNTFRQREKDRKKTDRLAQLGWTVLRVSNAQVAKMFST